MSAENNYSYNLTTPQRGKIYIAQSDPRNNVLGLSRLEARYGKGNVLVVPDYMLSKFEGAAGAIEAFTQESNSPLVLLNSGTLVGKVLSTGTNKVGLNPPVNLQVLSYTPKVDAAGGVTMDITISFDDVAGATGYEVVVSPTLPSSGLQPVVISNTSVAAGKITVTWQKISNVNNYVLTAKSGINIYSAAAPFDANTTTGSISVPSGIYSVYVTPYNSQGIAGPAGTVNNVTV